MSQRRPLQLVVSNRSVNVTALSQVKCTMVSAPLRQSQSGLSMKLAKLRRLRPNALVVIERLVDDLLAEVS
jgi:hypothetical protein